ncbi:Glutaminase [Peptoniphilus sp. ING2-D1G]|nr:Glutaminase [Peptoniphilus sp. ING2-D1G]
MQEILQRAYSYASKYLDRGRVADYIPELSKEDKNNLAGVIIDKDKEIYKIGLYDYKFSIQSIAKVAIYLCVLETCGFEEIKKHVGVKPSSKSFNSIIELELSNKRIPVNPFINAGAIVCTSLLQKKYGEDTFGVILSKLRLLADNENLNYSDLIFNSEKRTSYANRALANLMLSHNIISRKLNIEEFLDSYFKSCSVMVSTLDLAKMSYTLSEDGVNYSGENVLSSENARIIRTLMATCGTYDYSGEFAIRIGVPAKSGVGGGIMTAFMNKFGLATYCPGLDSHGNSYSGMRFLNSVSDDLNLKIY